MEYPFESRFIQTRDLNVHYLKEGSGPAIILLHGWPQTSYLWRNQIDSLAKHFTVYAPDNRGFGLTDKPRVRITRDLLARDVINFMDALNIQDAAVVGHDWGGIIGFKVAVDYAERVRQLCLIDTSTTTWPTWAGHAYWAKVPGVSMEFFKRCADGFLGWCFAGEQPDYTGVIAPFPPTPLPGAAYGWCDEKALAHYRAAFKNPDTHFATTEYYCSGLPMHRVLSNDISNDSNHWVFEYIGEQGCRDIWQQPGGYMKHPDLKQPLCFAPEDWNKKFTKPALFVYSPMLVPKAFEQGRPLAGYQLGGDVWQDSIARPFSNLQTRGIACGHFVPEEAPDALNEILLEFL